MRRNRLWWTQIPAILPADLIFFPSLFSAREPALQSSLFATSAIPSKSPTESRVHGYLFRNFPVRISELPSRGIRFQSSSKEDGGRCWSCGAALLSTPSLVCESCRCVQPLDRSVDFFQILGVEKKYDIEEGGLEGRYKEWQKKLHPDLVHNKSEREREYAAEQSAEVINAFQTLKNPLLRAMYLMKLQGIIVDEEQTIYEPDLLAEIMEIREAVDETSDSQTLKQMQSEVLEKLKHWSRCFGTAFSSRNMEEALHSIRRMTYYERINEEIEKKI